MDRGHRDLLAILVAVVMAVALFSAFSINLFHKTPAVILPSLAPLASNPPVGQGESGDYVRVEVTLDTVQQVIATLERPDSYARTVNVETVGAENASGASAASVTVDGGWTSTQLTLPDGRVCHSVVGEGKRYVWYDNQRRWQEYDASENSADLAQRLPTYEDILAADKESIVEAQYVLTDAMPCIYVAVAEPELGYVESYWVSVDTGLLVRSESSKDGQIFYRMSGYTVETPAAPGLNFTLPDGTVLHTTALPNSEGSSDQER